MDIVVIGIEEITVANDKIEDRIRIAIWLGWIAPKNIEDGAPIVTARRGLAVGVVVCFTSRVGEAFHLKPISRSN